MKTATINNFSKYIFYDNGEVFNIKRKKFIKKHLNDSGYERIRLLNDLDNKRHIYYIHRLIFQAFNPNVNIEGFDIDHINHIRNDNRLCNLRCLTHQENNKNRTKNNKYHVLDKLNYEKNKEKHKKYGKQYRNNHKERIKEYNKQYYERNKEQLMEYQKQYRNNHKEQFKKYDRCRRVFNKEIKILLRIEIQ